MIDLIPPVEQLVTFKRVAELGSFKAAAEALNITQSAVSHRIAKLENQLGIRLLDRNARGLHLTDSGETLLTSIRDPLNELSAAFQSLGRPSSGKLLKIQVESAFSAGWLSRRLETFIERHPTIQLELQRASNAALADGAHIAIKWGSGHWPGLHFEPLMTICYTSVCAPRVADQYGLRQPSDLAGAPLLHDRRYHEWKLWAAMAGVTGLNIARGHIVEDTNILIEMAVQGRGVALGSPELLERELTSGALIMPFPDLRLWMDEGYYIVTGNPANLPHFAHYFIDWLKAEVALFKAG